MSNPHPAVAGILTSIVRTVVPLIVGFIITAAAKANIEIPSGLLDEAVLGVVTTVYYAIVRLLETKVAPAYGWLLGVANRPSYENA